MAAKKTLLNNLTFYTHPKPWLPEFSDIQSAAIQSWKALVQNPKSQIVLLGDDLGTAQSAIKLGVGHRGSIETNQWGTPLVSSIFDVIKIECQTELSCFINTDIVLSSDFADTLEATCHSSELEAQSEGWLLIGQRTDVNIPYLSGMTSENIVSFAREKGTLHAVDGIDYFVFPRHTFQFVYPFALGKFCWDQWIVGNAFRRGLICIDATKTVFAVHLNAKWFFRGQPEHRWDFIHKSEEGLINRNFDYYQRTIGNGTTHATRINGTKLQIHWRSSAL